MHILLTGGTGLIGTALVKHWLNQHKLVVLTRDPARAQQRLGPEVCTVQSLQQVDFNQIDAVINLAGEPIVGKRWSHAQKRLLCESRWMITEQLVGAIKAASSPPSVLISGSAIGIYGRQQQQFIDENYTLFNPEFASMLCLQWEQLAQEAQSEHTRVCLLRTGIVLANEGGALKKMLPPFKLGLGGRIGTGEQYMSWVHLQDMLRLTDFLLQHPTLTGAFNATAPNPVTNAEFSQQLASALHRPAILPMPAVVLKLMLGEMADLLLTGQRVIPAKLQHAGFTFNYTQLPDALEALQG